MLRLLCRFLFRIYQYFMKVAAGFIPWRNPILIEGENSVLNVPIILQEKGIKNILFVTGKHITKLGLNKDLLQAFEKVGIEYVIYDGTVPNPTIDNIEEALKIFQTNNCQAIVVFGGGSHIDCAKGVGARVARPNKTVLQLKGTLKIQKSIPLLIAIPTTAGTGSETSLAAVISNTITHEKYILNDTCLIPDYAVLDPLITLKLPVFITATTGMDALTHAIEAYIGRSNTEVTRKNAREAIKIIFENLPEACKNGNNVTARGNMLKGSFYAGKAFTKAYVGYVHAIAHTLSGFYSIPHGLANAVILPYVLEYYGKSVQKKLAELADVIGLGSSVDNDAIKAKKFIESIKDLQASIGIPKKVEGIKKEDIPFMITNALNEANPFYPVPKILFKDDMKKLYDMIR